MRNHQIPLYSWFAIGEHGGEKITESLTKAQAKATIRFDAKAEQTNTCHDSKKLCEPRQEN